MRIRFTRPARRHRIGRAHAMYVIETVTPRAVAATDGADTRLIWIGPDDRGLELEIVALDLPDEMARHPRDADSVEEEAVIEPEDVDLASEVVLDRQGRRITDEYAERAAEEASRIVRGAGRPPLDDEGGSAPRVSFRVPAQVRRRAEERAAQEGRSVSALARDALERYLHEAG